MSLSAIDPKIACVCYFFAGLFLSNAIPHIVAGVSGRPFQSPFAKPPGKGLSTSTVNVAWGTFNLVVAYVLIGQVGIFDPRSITDAAALGLGFLVMSLLAARMFGELHGGNAPDKA